MYIRVALVFCYVLLGHVVADIASNKQCSFASISNTCTPPDPNLCPSSAGCLKVLWTEFKPYSYRLKDSTFKGIISGILETLMEDCCSTCWKLNFTDSVSRQTITTAAIPQDINISLPYSASSEDDKIKGMNFVKLVEYPSVVYITKKESASAIPRKLIGAIWNAWPVLIMALLLSLVAGVLLWFLEFWQNPEEFPASFFKGAWEGFWWAFVSMTTVGYGDRAPRSYLGRIFAIFWIMIGICICSIFTATLTTSLTTITLEEKKTLARARVGAIRNSLEASAGISSKAKVINYNSTGDLWRALENENVEGILLDSYFSATPEISSQIEDNDYRISQTIEVNERSYGILVRDDNLARCLRDEYDEMVIDREDEITEIITNEIGSESTENEAAARSDSIFNPTGDIFYPSLYTCIGFAIMMLITGLLWEFVCMKKCYKQGVKDSSVAVAMNAKNLDEMEKEMIADVQRMFAAWRAQRDLDIGIAGPMEVVDVEQNGEQFGMKKSQQFPQQQPVTQ